MRIWPPVETVTRRHLISLAEQLPPDGLVMSMLAAVFDCPVPLKVIKKIPFALITAFGDPSPELLVWMMRGATLSEGALSHEPVGSLRLMIQFLPASDSAHALVTEETS
ncbi:hypothetical protein AT959_03665 [Dechloromonas denitrificans]|uniref:Uncharacterized protein n=1 Tax=Dechloromonas denitrificans TaxID=281362 RepID=A0A133XML0_9RHOO|nr:hypothetical protein AT959_03665 [Dechloromonas denitrificans]